MREQDMEVIKVKAHRTLEEAVADGDPEHFAGNDMADLLAKEAAKYWPVDADEMDHELAFRMGWRKHYCWVAKGLG